MALPLGKLTIIIGAAWCIAKTCWLSNKCAIGMPLGIIGSALAKEGGFSTVSDYISGAFKIFYKQISHDNSAPSSAKPRNDSLLAQVNSLREELQLLASNRSITIVTSSGSGSRRYGVVVIVIVVGYGYIWWKGWKLPDMMFATKRGLSDACNTIAKQLENVYSSVAATKRHLSSRIDQVDCSLDECAELTAATREEVSELRGEMKGVGVDVQSVHHAVRTLETKISRIEGKQVLTNEGVRRLVDYAWDLENSRTTELIQDAPSSSSRPALEMAHTTPLSRIGSLPPIPSDELPSPSTSYGSQKRPLQNEGSGSGLKELRGISDVVDALTSPDISNGVHATTQDKNNGNPGYGLFGRNLSGFSASFLTRTRSAVQSFK